MAINDTNVANEGNNGNERQDSICTRILKRLDPDNKWLTISDVEGCWLAAHGHTNFTIRRAIAMMDARVKEKKDIEGIVMVRKLQGYYDGGLLKVQ